VAKIDIAKGVIRDLLATLDPALSRLSHRLAFLPILCYNEPSRRP
jgi:hypothetical protein